MSNKLTVCKACNKEIAKSAKTCPHCGAKNKKKHYLLIAIVVIIVLACIIASSGDSGEPKKVDNANTPGVTTPKTNKNNSNKKTEFYIGETAELKNIRVTLMDVSVSSGSSYNKPADGNVFVICEFEIANNSKEEITVSSILNFEAYCDDYACEYSLSALMEKGSKNQLDGTVAAGKKMRGVIGFEVSADWIELEIRYTPDLWSEKQIIFVANN